VFEIFSGPARQAILLAQDEAIGLGDDFVGTEHLLTGLAGVPDGVAGELLADHGLSVGLARARATEIRPAGQRGAAIAPADALAAIGVDVAAIRQRADEAFGPGAFVYPRPAYDAAARAAIEDSVAQAEALGHDYVGTGHLLLGMLAGGDNAGARILGSVGLGEASGRPLALTRTAERRE
jgi:ATP-dependent Clp protease ATP-binding subunit ClpA